MGSKPKPTNPIAQTGSGIAGIESGAANVAAAPNTPTPASIPQSYAPIQQPPAEEAPMMPLTSPALPESFAPNSQNPLGPAAQANQRAQILKTLFSVNQGGR